MPWAAYIAPYGLTPMIDYDMPWDDYKPPKTAEVEKAPFVVGDRVRVVGCGYGVIIGRWLEWWQVKLDVCGTVGKKASGLRAA